MTTGRWSRAKRPGAPVRFTFAGREVVAYEGESIAAALWAAGVRATRRSTVIGAPRGVYCNMGVCYECLVRIEGREVRACMAAVRDGATVEPA